jgi:signal transduction histidine kinase
MSHELRTPLHVIIGYSDLIADEVLGPLTVEQADGVKRVGSSARRLHDLITNTLDMSRLESGTLSISNNEIGAAAVLRDLQLDVAHLAKPGVELLWRPEAGLPALQTDAGKLKVVLKNLLTNALKFTESGSVTISAAPRDGGVEFAVVDTGIGIPSEARDLIFEPFRQADPSVGARLGGVGLGLHIVRRLTDLLGARITLESEVGRGSTFRVWFPPPNVTLITAGAPKGEVVDSSTFLALRATRARKVSSAGK